MPTLKQVTCSIELGSTNTKLKEYSHRYVDGGVESFVAVPEADIPFQVHVTSNGYIAPGLAAYLFIDGQYQCNRNRQRLRTPDPDMDPREYEIDFMLRQREEKTSEGLFVAREWTFSKLQTANADLAPNDNPNYAKNVGTIEVLLLRCKDSDIEVGTEELVDSTGAPAAASHPAQITKPYSKAPSKAPSKAASKVSTKKASEAGTGGFGGMFGLFDGAGDHPGYPSYTPRYRHDAQPSPGYPPYRDNRYEPRPYTVHGGRNYGTPLRPEVEETYGPRPRTADDHYAPLSPMEGYSFHQRRRFEPRLPQPMAPQPMDRVIYTPFPQQHQQPQHAPTPEGFKFIRELCQAMDDSIRLQFEERQKFNEMQEDARLNRNDAEVHLAAVKAVRGQEEVISKLQEECAALFATLLARMNRMDEAEWNFVRDYVVLEKRVVPISHPEFQQWRDPRQQQFSGSSPRTQSANASGVRDDDWQEMGQGQVGGRLWQQKTQQPQGPSGQQNGLWNQGQDGGNQGNNDNWNHGNQNVQGDTWGNADQGNNNDGGWNGSGGQSNRGNSNNNGWGGDNNNDNNNGGGGWGQQSGTRGSRSHRTQGQSQGQGWGGNNDNDGNDGWNNRDDTKSRTAQSKVKSWDAGGRNGGGGGGWSDNKSASKGGGGDGWGAKPASKHDSRYSRRPTKRGDASTVVAPVIKSYWADWDKHDQGSGRLRPKPREPYEYPALAPPVAASGKASSVNYGVQAGRGANYAHQTYRPEYLDTMQKPYAIFTFKYRSKSALEKILRRNIDTGEVERAVRESEKDNLMKMPKDELVSNMMRMKVDGGANAGRGKPPAKSSSKAGSGNGWGKQASKAPSKKNDGWGNDAGGGGWNDGPNDEPVKPSDSASQWGGGGGNEGGGQQGGWGNQDNGGGGGGWDNKKKAPSRKSHNGGGDGWGNNNAGGGGGGGWGGNDNQTDEHFAGDPALQQTGGGGW